MMPTVSTHILITAWLLLSSCAALATTTTIQVPLAGTVYVLLNDGNFDAVTLAGRVNVVA